MPNEPRALGQDATSLRDCIVAFYPPELRQALAVTEVAAHFQAIAAAETLAARLDALVALVEWSRATGTGADGAPDRSRLHMIGQVLAGVAQARAGVQETFAGILSETEGVNLFGEAGIPGDRGLFKELSNRVLAKLLPQPSDEHDLSRLMGRLYSSTDAIERMRNLPEAEFHQLAEAVAPAGRRESWAPLRAAFADGFRLLAVRVQAQGLAGNLRARSHAAAVAASPFYRLAQASHALMDCWLAGQDVSPLVQAWREDCAGCRSEMAQITRRLDADGVSVDIVYGLEVLDRCLSRMDLMLEVASAPPGQAHSAAVQRLLVELMLAAKRDRSVRQLLRASMQMLERKIVERSGKTGEHYVAGSRSEYRMIWLAAAGGGLLTVFTAAVKLEVAHAGLPLFVEGLASGLNYAVSFLFLHHLHLVLATKQPAMTAATLASLLRNRDRTARLDSVVDFMTRISSSQVAAAVANVAVVFLGAFAFNALWQALLGRNYLGVDEAQHLFETLSPVNSGTVFYAAFTGVVLWAAAMVGGWFDNWSAYRRLPQGIADHPLGRRLGRPRMAKAAGIVSRNMSGWATNISLGFMLGMAPVLGKFLGLPIDVRHVTLSSGMLAFGASGLEDWFTRGWFFLALGGVATMFVLNLSVSFLLSLYTASRAYDLGAREMGVLGMRLLRRLLASPLDFLLPRTVPEAPPQSGGGDARRA
jgi:site-specific recombinase